MSIYKAILSFSNGEEEELDEEFVTEEEAVEFGNEKISDYHYGMELLRSSNPGEFSEELDVSLRIDER